MKNTVSLIGRLGADPEVRRLSSGDPVVSLRLATWERWKDKATGERKEKTEWHSVVIFNENICRTAEQYLKKGSLCAIEGSIQTRKWQDQSGQDRYSTEIVLQRFGGSLLLLGDPQGRPAQDPDSYGTTRTRGEGSSERRPSGGAGTGGKPAYDLDDDIPF